jgi:hypothetical protein
MKAHRTFAFLLALAFAGAPAVQLAGEPFTVHEWGTFTTVSGSDGKLLPGLEAEENALPPFVHSHAGFSPANKGWDRPVANVTVKMETPVLYFYSDVPRSVQVDVKFHGGSISQWYPDRAGGETLPALPSDETVSAALKQEKFPEHTDPEAVVQHVITKLVSPVVFSPEYLGSASWRVDVLAPDTPEKISARHEWETPQWPRARVASANKVRGPNSPLDNKPEVEGFIFYRGIGNFPLPLKVESDGNVRLTNTGAQKIPFLFFYEKRAEFPQGAVWWSGALAAGTSKTVPLLKSFGDISRASMTEKKFPEALQRAGLTAEEARAMIATWKESYFERDGLRIFWIVPRAFTDSILPITISPKPEKLERVLVGRTEVLRPAFEAELKRDFAADRGKRWIGDRYYAAYQSRAQQLGVVLPPVRP